MTGTLKYMWILTVLWAILSPANAFTSEFNKSLPKESNNEISCRDLCKLSPEAMEGPYYVPNQKNQPNICEDQPGSPLKLKIVLKDTETCQWIEGAQVHIWHSNAKGDYSGVKGSYNLPSGTDKNKTTTYCRGIQVTNSTGSVEFETIYPGWYNGRAIHIHVEIYAGGNLTHIAQLYFPQEINNELTLTKPYSDRWTVPLPNALDWVYRNQGGAETILKMDGSINDNYLSGYIELGLDPAMMSEFLPTRGTKYPESKWEGQNKYSNTSVPVSEFTGEPI